MPLVVGFLGVSLANFEINQETSAKHNSAALIKLTLLENSNILFNVLDLYGIFQDLCKIKDTS